MPELMLSRAGECSYSLLTSAVVPHAAESHDTQAEH